MSHQLHPAADAELSDAAKYYAAEASLRVFPFRRFPYSLVYRESENGPRILALAHHKREPEYWESRG